MNPIPTLAGRLARVRALRIRVRSNFHRLEAEIAALEDALQGLGRPRLPRTVPRAQQINTITVADAAEKVMRGKGPMTAAEVTRAIERRKLYKPASRRFYSTVLATLRRNGRFQHVGRGTYKLAPGRPRIRRPRMTLVQAAARVLEGHDGPMRPIEVARAIRARGLYKSAAESPYANVVATLAHHRRFQRVGWGLYALAEKPRGNRHR